MNSDDPRTGSLITTWNEKPKDQLEIVLVGFPYDEGVRRNGGRVGAAKGPECARSFIQKVGTVVNPEFHVDCDKIIISDSGDVFDPDWTLEDAHNQLFERVKQIIDNNATPFVIGGGNDQSFPNAMGLFRNSSSSSIGVVNIDAHLDVRPLKENKAHSGSPFYQLLTSDEWKAKGAGFLEFAAQGSQCSQTHADFVTKTHQQSICWLSDILSFKCDKDIERNYRLPFGNYQVIRCLEERIESMQKKPSELFISFDIDSIQSSDCPGVSCPATVGLSSAQALDICFWAGANQNVKLFDLSEFNPTVDDYRTGRLVANMFYYFALGRSAL